MPPLLFQKFKDADLESLGIAVVDARLFPNIPRVRPSRALLNALVLPPELKIDSEKVKI